MCNNTSRDPVKVGGQPSNEASSDSEEFNSEKIADVPMDEQMNNSNNSNASLSNLNASPNHQLAGDQQIDSLVNGINDSFGSTNASRLLQTMNLLLSSQLSSDSLDEPQPAPNGELLEVIQRLLAQNGNNANQSLTNSLLAAAASQRATSFACKFCAFTTSKRQQLIRHVRTSCEGLLAAMATGATNNTKSTTTTQNSTNADCSSPTGEQPPVTNEELAAGAPLLSPAVLAALNNDQLSSGCGNLACVNSNCTNGNSCVLLPNAGSVLNEKLKIGQPADDSEEDYANSANPQDRYCTECEIQFVSYKNYKVHKQIYCGSRHCSQKVQPTPVTANPRKRTISDTLQSSLPASLVNSGVSITQLLSSAAAAAAAANQSSASSPSSGKNSLSAQSPQHQSAASLFTQTASTAGTPNPLLAPKHSPGSSSSLLNTNANHTSEAGTGPSGLQQTTQSAGGMPSSTSLAGLSAPSASSPTHCNIPPSLSSASSMNAHQTALLNELFANGNIINLSTSLNLIQQLTQPAYIAISTNPLILLPINQASSNGGVTSSVGHSASTTTTTTTSSTTAANKLSSQEVAEQLKSQLNGLINQAVLEGLTTKGDEPIDLSKRKCPTTRLNSVVSLLEPENFADNPQLLKNISINALNTLSNQNSTEEQMAAAAFLLPKALTTLNAQQLMLKPQSRIYSCNNCQIEFHKQENYVVHKKYYCSATKQQQALLEAAGSSLNSLNSFGNSLNHNLNQINSLNSLNTQKQSPSTSIDDLDAANQLLNSAPNSPQSIHSQTGQSANRTASSSAATAATMNLVDTLVNQAAAVANKKSSSSSSLANNSNSKTSGCVSPSISISPVGSPPSFNQLAAQPSANPVQPIYKHFCSKCGIRFTSKDNLHAHQTYYCGNNSTTGLNGGLTITNFNSASGLIEVNCPKCLASYCSEEAFLAHICSANVSASSQVSTVNVSSTNSTLTSTSAALSSTTSSLLDALESIKQQSFTSKLTSSLLNSAVASNSLMTNTTKSSNNSQAFRCTICNYRGHTLRGMKTHVRVHGDQLHGAQEENFIVPLNDDCCGLPIATNGNCTNANCRNTRTVASLNSNSLAAAAPATNNKRRRSTDPMSSILSNMALQSSSAGGSMLNKEQLLLANQLLMGNLMNNLTSHLGNHLVSGLVGSNLANAGLPAGLSINASTANDLISSAATSEAEDNMDHLDSQPSGSLTCNGTQAAVSVSSNSNNNIGKC